MNLPEGDPSPDLQRGDLPHQQQQPCGAPLVELGGAGALDPRFEKIPTRFDGKNMGKIWENQGQFQSFYRGNSNVFWGGNYRHF